jgi:TRAP-type mannitol/chloroaromatic compound transport system permease large subunit
MIGLVMFAVALVLLLVGFPVAFTFGGVAVFFGLLAEGPKIFSLMPHRIWSIMNNTILMAIPYVNDRPNGATRDRPNGATLGC